MFSGKAKARQPIVMKRTPTLCSPPGSLVRALFNVAEDKRLLTLLQVTDALEEHVTDFGVLHAKGLEEEEKGG